MHRSILALVVSVAVALAAPLAQARVSDSSQLSTLNSQLSLVPYIALSDLRGKIPERDLLAALDDNQDGEIDADVWEQIQLDVQTEIDGTLGQRFNVPFADPLPAVVKLGAQILAIEAVYNHRGLLNEKSPERIEAKNFRTKLAAIANGEQPLAPDQKRARPSASAITSPSRTHSDRPAI